MDFTLHNGSGSLSYDGVSRPTNKLNTYDWLAGIPTNTQDFDIVEVQFKNTRKEYFRNSNHISLKKGDVVAVEASPGHDIGVVTLTGRLVALQMKKAKDKPNQEIKRVYRVAKPIDLEKYEEAKAKEHSTMIRSRQIAARLNLDMKIGDVEYQGDGNKAIFYYIADGRVDFRQLIKDLASEFRIRIEMKQIGARQEAGRIGGIGPCGRELCCASWMRNFVSVSTNAARIQDISLNPQKLAGQCAKLKCCLNYEVDAYVEAQKKLPSKEVTLETQDGTYYFFKADILNNQITYSSDKYIAANLITLNGQQAFDVIAQNKKGQKPDLLMNLVQEDTLDKPKDILEQDSLTRFDQKKRSNKRGRQRNNSNRNNNNRSRNNNQKQQNNNKQTSNTSTRSNRERDTKDNREQGVNRNTKRPTNRRPYKKRRPSNKNNQQKGPEKGEKQ